MPQKAIPYLLESDPDWCGPLACLREVPLVVAAVEGAVLCGRGVVSEHAADDARVRRAEVVVAHRTPHALVTAGMNEAHAVTCEKILTGLFHKTMPPEMDWVYA